MPFIGFDIYRLKVGFMEWVFVFKSIAAGGEEDHGFKSLKQFGVKLRESLTKALEDCHPFASTKPKSN
jgi:hypothetical protein